MTRYRVRFTSRSRHHLSAIARHVATASSRTMARALVASIVEFCQQLSLFPERGSDRGDIAPGVRILGFRRRVSIVFRVHEAEARVLILGIYYGGRSDETLRNESDLSPL